MGQRDLAQNDYFNDKVRFADAGNGILFHGKEIIKPEELEEVNADIVYREERKLRKVIPDKVWLWNGIYVAFLSVENQTMVDYSMVFRVMKEDAVSYERQWKKREKDYRRQGILKKKEHLCWVGKDERFIPVITVVIYYGTDKKWDGATCLYDMLHLDKDLEPYVTNYKINLFDYHDHEDFSVFKTENRLLFEMLSCSQDKKKMRQLLKEKQGQYKNVDTEAFQTICDIIGVKSTPKLEEKIAEEQDMCKAIEEWAMEERQEGRLEGRQEGILEGRRELLTVIIRKKVSKNLTLDAIADALEEDIEVIRPIYEEVKSQSEAVDDSQYTE